MLLNSDTPFAFLVEAPRFLFFTGKGGVGKTSLSSAAAVFMADQGKRILLVSTDPASNLDQVLETSLGSKPLPISEATGLFALNIDPRKAAEDYKERVVTPYRGVLPETALVEMEEQLSGACTVEIAAFNEFSKLLTDNQILSQFDHILFDTAPTGHTLRLLRLSGAWDSYLDGNSGDGSCLGPMSGLKSYREQFEDTLKNLTDSTLTRLILICRPDMHSIGEAARTSKELLECGMGNQWLAINGILEEDPHEKDSLALEITKSQQKEVGALPERLASLPQVKIPLFPASPVGISALRAFGQRRIEVSDKGSIETAPSIPEGTLEFSELIEELSAESGIIMTMGKGGVGKTTLATLIATRLCQQGRKVHLTTSDPAAHFDRDLRDAFPHLKVSCIDPREETEKYTREVMEQVGSSLDEKGRSLLEEDLRSPCTEEVAVFRAFARLVEEAKDSIVVLDTAPTGHTLLLLDATEAYHRDVSRNSSTSPEEVLKLLPRLRDPGYTRVLIVTLPEGTPVQEARALQADLKRGGINPFAWVVNQSLTPLRVSNPILSARRIQERKHFQQIAKAANKIAVVSWDPNLFNRSRLQGKDQLLATSEKG